MHERKSIEGAPFLLTNREMRAYRKMYRSFENFISYDEGLDLKKSLGRRLGHWERGRGAGLN